MKTNVEVRAGAGPAFAKEPASGWQASLLEEKSLGVAGLASARRAPLPKRASAGQARTVEESSFGAAGRPTFAEKRLPRGKMVGRMQLAGRGTPIGVRSSVTE